MPGIFLESRERVVGGLPEVFRKGAIEICFSVQGFERTLSGFHGPVDYLATTLPRGMGQKKRFITVVDEESEDRRREARDSRRPSAVRTVGCSDALAELR